VNYGFHRTAGRVGLKSVLQEISEKVGHPFDYRTGQSAN
jgi:hypothetical protein